MNDWVETTWGDVITLQRGFDITKSEQDLTGLVPIVSSGGIASFHSLAAADGPGVVMGRKGTLGRVYFLNEPYWPHDTTLWVKDFKGNEARFVFYALKTLDVGHLDVGSANPTLNRNHVHPIAVRWPRDISEQRRIASVLGALDNLIGVEQRNAERCDDLWRTLIRARQGTPIEVPLSSLATFVNGKNFTKDASGSGLPVIRTPEVRNGPSTSTVQSDVDADEDNRAEPGDILFVWSGSLLVGRWLWQRGLINQHIFKVIPHDGTPDWLALWAVGELMEVFRGVAADKATTMGHIKRSDLNRTVALPEPGRWNDIDKMVRPLWGEALQARMHAAQLARNRDELLTLLISGRVRVADAEAA